MRSDREAQYGAIEEAFPHEEEQQQVRGSRPPIQTAQSFLAALVSRAAASREPSLAGVRAGGEPATEAMLAEQILRRSTGSRDSPAQW